MSFGDSDKRLDVVLHYLYLHPFFHKDLKCCCKSSQHLCNNSNIIYERQYDIYIKVCFKKNSNNMNSSVCYNTTKPTDDNTTLIPFTTPNIVQFMINNENMTLEVILLTFVYKIYTYM